MVVGAGDGLNSPSSFLYSVAVFKNNEMLIVLQVFQLICFY